MSTALQYTDFDILFEKAGVSYSCSNRKSLPMQYEDNGHTKIHGQSEFSNLITIGGPPTAHVERPREGCANLIPHSSKRSQQVGSASCGGVRLCPIQPCPAFSCLALAVPLSYFPTASSPAFKRAIASGRSSPDCIPNCWSKDGMTSFTCCPVHKRIRVISSGRGFRPINQYVR